MRLLLITPYFPPAAQGNAVTTGRLAHGLRQRGVDVRVVSLDRDSTAVAARQSRDFAPDLIHGFHCYRSAEAVSAAVDAHAAPYVLTATGTDLNHDLDNAERRDTVLAMLRGAARLIAFHESMTQRVNDAIPELAGRVAIIPQSVLLPASDRDFRAALRIGGGEIVFALPAGLRPVKNVRFALAPIAALQREGLPVRLLLVGPVLDEAYAHSVFEEMREGMHYLGEVPHSHMSALHRAADVALNTSLSEGGMCNSVLEAMSLSKPVLASDIAGNRSVVRDGESGLLFTSNDAGHFLTQARRLASDGQLRGSMGAAGAEMIARDFSFEREMEEHMRLYESAVSGLAP